MEKRVIIFLILSLAIIFGYDYILKELGWLPQSPQNQDASKEGPISAPEDARTQTREPTIEVDKGSTEVARQSRAGKPSPSSSDVALPTRGDTITIDARRRELRIDVPERVLASRRAQWKPPAPRYTAGVLAKYARLVSSSSTGAVTDG